MSNYKGPTEGGSGGKRGHSNMEHWEYTEEIKRSNRSKRRRDDKVESHSGIQESDAPNDQNLKQDPKR